MFTSLFSLIKVISAKKLHGKLPGPDMIRYRAQQGEVSKSPRLARRYNSLEQRSARRLKIDCIQLYLDPPRDSDNIKRVLREKEEM